MSSPDFQLFTSTRYDHLLLQIPANSSHWPIPDASPSPFYMLPYHRDRMLQAAERFQWPKAISSISGPSGFSFLLQKLKENIDMKSPTPLRVKILVSREGEINVETNPTPQVPAGNLFPFRLPPPSSALNDFCPSSLTGGALILGPNESIPGDPQKGSSPWPILLDTAKTQPSPYTSHKTTSRDMYNLARERVGIEDMAEKTEVLVVSEKDGEIMEGSLTSVFFWRDGSWLTPEAGSGGQVGTTRRWGLEKG